MSLHSMECDGHGSAVEDQHTDGFDVDDVESDALLQSDEGLMTVVRQDCASPELSTERKRMMEFIPDETSNMFAPVKTLNFSDADVTHDDGESQDEATDRNEGQFERSPQDEASAGSNLIDLEWMEEGSEYQNMRIIEGHDSSPLEHQILRSTLNHAAVTQQQNSPHGHGSVTMQTSSSQSRQDQFLPPTSQQFDQSVVSQSVFSPLKEDLDVSGRGSPNLYDSLDERDSEYGQYGSKRTQDGVAYQHPVSGIGPAVSMGQDYLGIEDSVQNTIGDHHSNQLQHYEGDVVNSNNNMEGLSTRINVLPMYGKNISITSPGNHQQNQQFDKHQGQIIPGGLASWEDVEHENVNVGSNPLMRCSVVGHGVASTRSRSADSQQRPGNGGPAPASSRLTRTEQRQVTHISNGQGGIGRGTVGRHSQNRPVPCRVAVRPRPIVQGAGHPRPVVQGSSMADLKKVQKLGITTNASRPKVDVKDKRQTNDRSLDRISGVGSEGPQKQVQSVTSVADTRSASGTPPILVQTSVISPRIAALNKSPSVGHEPIIGRFRVSEGFGHLDGDDESVHTHMDEPMHTGYKLSPRQNELSPQSVNMDVQGMEDVRSHLQNMLRLSTSTFVDKPSFDPTDTASEFLMDPTFKRSFSSRIQDDVPDLFENFPNYSSTIYPDLSESAISRHDMSFQPDQPYMREALEKERYRRKHCEQQIHLLNMRLLETQQQLAVAIATDKKKDTMIEQLDKQLAKVVEGWKKREMEKDDYLRLILKEKTNIEQSLHQQQEMINNFESDMAHTIDELKKEKENSAQAIDNLRRQIDEKSREKSRAEEQLDAERERGSLITQEWEQLKETRELAEVRAQQLQERLHKEQDDWYKREQDLLATIDDVKEANLKVIHMEKSKSDEYQSLAADIEERLRAAQTQNTKLEMDIDVLEREKESVKVEIAIIEAKYETAQRKLEADLHSQMEKEIAEQVSHVQEKMDELNTEMQDKHRQQIKEIHQRHQADLEHHMQEFHDDAKKKDEDYRQQIQSYEERLKEYRNENTSLKHAKQKLESQRMEVLSKLQYMMQSQWNEAVSLLVNTPQRNSQGLQNHAQMNLGMSGTPEPKTSSPKEARSHPRTADNKRNTPPPGTLHSVNQVERYLQSLHLGETDIIQTDNPAFVMSQDPNASFVSEVSLDSQPPVPIHSTYEEARMAARMPEQYNFMDQFFSNQSEQLPMNIHGYLVNQMTKSLPNQNVSSENAANENREFQSMGSLPNPAVMIRPPQQQSRPIKGGNPSGFRACPPSPKKGVHGHKIRHRSAEDDPRWQTEPEHDDRSYTGSPSYMHSPRHLSRHGMSPPVKQTRRSQEVENHAEMLVTDGGEEVEDAVRLDKDYNDISERVAEHESRQEELQHYIKMLLDRPPASEQNLPVGAEILESSQEATSELDLNDTAQAAQLNRELKRIQELRERLNPATDGSRPEREKPTSNDHGSRLQGVLPPEQLSEISRLLDEYRTRWETSPKPQIDDSVTQLLDLLQNLPNRQVVSVQSTELRHPSDQLSPRSKSRILITSTKKAPGVKPAQINISRATADTSRRSESESEKSYSAAGVRKMDRKMIKTGQKSRLSAWK